MRNSFVPRSISVRDIEGSPLRHHRVNPESKLTSMDFQRTGSNTTASMRRLLILAGLLVLIIGLPLYFVPQNADQYFSWSVSPLSAVVLGGAYLSAAVIEFSAARRRAWADTRIAIPAVLVFTSLTLFVSLTNTNEYHFNSSGLVQSFGTWAWFAVYLVVPPLMLVILSIQMMRGGRTPERQAPIPTSLRAGLTLIGGALFIGGVTLLANPSAASWMWPWPLTTITSQAFGAWMIGFAVAMVHMALEADWKRVQPATAGAGVLGSLQLLAILRFRQEIAWNTPQVWVYATVLGGFVALGACGYWATRLRRSEPWL